MELTLGEIATSCAVELKGDPSIKVRGVTTLHNGQAGYLTFLANPRYRKYLSSTRASAVILAPGDVADCPVAALVSDNPYLTYARVAALLTPPPASEPGIHPTAVVDETARISPDSHVGPNAVVGAGVELAAGVYVGPGCVLEAGVSLGSGTRLVANVTLCRDVTVGARTLIHPGVVIGADGFGLARDNNIWLKVPQLGSVEIGDDVEIGANTTIDRGALGNTVIEDGVKLDNQIQIGHNVRIGAHTAIAGCVGIAGSTTVGKRCMLAGGAGLGGHIEIADDVVITAATVVTHTIHQPGVYSGGVPSDKSTKWRKNSVRFKQLDELARRLFELEKNFKGSSNE